MTHEERQEKFNDRITAAIEKITEALNDLEKHTVKVDSMQTEVKDHETRIRLVERSMDFVTSARRVFAALIIALTIGSVTAVWQVVKDDGGITKADIKELIDASNKVDKQ